MRSSEAARLVREVVCAYSREELPTSWVQVFRRFEHTVAKARLRVRVRLLPLEELPERVDVLVVPEPLRARAAALRSGARVLATDRPGASAAADALVRELLARRTLYAEPARPDEPRIVTRRGSDVL